MPKLNYDNVQAGEYKDIDHNAVDGMIQDRIAESREHDNQVKEDTMRVYADRQRAVLEGIESFRKGYRDLSRSFINLPFDMHEAILPEYMLEEKLGNNYRSMRLPGDEKIDVDSDRVIDVIRQASQTFADSQNQEYEIVEQYKQDARQFLDQAKSLREQGKNEEAEEFEAKVRFIGHHFKDRQHFGMLLHQELE